MNEILYFDSIREKRDSYFVEYYPPTPNSSFATLNLVFPNEVSWKHVSELLDEEVRHWMGRYRVPLMVWAFDSKEDIIRPSNHASDCLVAWISSENGEVIQSWDCDALDVILKQAEHQPDWRTIYADVPVRTNADVKAAARSSLLERRRQLWTLNVILTLWFAVIPAGYAVFELLGPKWLSLFGFVFVLYKVLRAISRIWSLIKPSAKEKMELEKQRKMNHYFYHCEQNPEGFMRLKVENFENDSRNRVRKEYEEIGTKAGR